MQDRIAASASNPAGTVAGRPSLPARSLQPAFAVLLALACTACITLAPRDRDRAAIVAEQARHQDIPCMDSCIRPSPLYDLGLRAEAASTKEVPRHYALILDDDQDALLARLDLIRSATRSIDLPIPSTRDPDTTG